MRYFITDETEMSAAIRALVLSPRVSHDVESYGHGDISGLHPFHGAQSYAYVFATKEDEYYFSFAPGDLPEYSKFFLSVIFKNPEKIIFYVNAVFDNCFLYLDGIENHSRIVDCPSIARVDYSRHGKDEYSEESFLGLDYLAQYYLKKRKNSELSEYIEQNDLYQKNDSGEYINDRFNGKKIPLFQKVPFEIAANYACDDARLTYDIGTAIISSINAKATRFNATLLAVAQNEIRLTSEVIAMKISGLKVWTEYVNKAIKHEQNISDAALLEIAKIAPGLNINSTDQLGKFLESKGVKVNRITPTPIALKRAAKWALEANEFRAKGKEKKALEAEEKAAKYRIGNYSLDAKELFSLAEKYTLPFLHEIIKTKKAEKKIATYYGNFLLLKDADDIIHCNLHQETTKTGRFSSSSPNLQNLHKEKWKGDDEEFLIRRSFIAPEPDEVLLFADYRQQEMMVMLDQAEEMSIIKLLLDGVHDDFYLATNAIIREKTGKILERQQAKGVALGLAYGQGIALLATNLKCKMDEAKEMKETFFSALTRLKELDRKLKVQAKVYGYIVNPFGRVIYITPGKDYTALNAFVQSTSADITKTAIVNIGARFKKENIKSKMALTVHDELIFRAKENEIEKIIPIIQYEMSRAYPHKHLALGTDIQISHKNKHGVSPWGEKVDYVVE